MEKPVFFKKTGFQAAATLPQVQVLLWAKALPGLNAPAPGAVNSSLR
jgi:hypothetical protein